jgi:hypothetical protein
MTSDYTYDALLAVRSAQVAGSPPAPCECLVVWGTVSATGVLVEPAFETRAHVALGQGGSHRLEALDGAGRVLFTEWFTPAAIDHAPGVRQFLLAVPRDRAGPAHVAAIRVVDAAGRVSVAPSGTVVPAPITARRIGPEPMQLTWDPTRTPAILARDPVSGKVMGIGRSGRLVLRTANPAVEVTASQGAATSSVRLVVP